MVCAGPPAGEVGKMDRRETAFPESIIWKHHEQSFSSPFLAKHRATAILNSHWKLISL
jgi:hypothetical protein